MYFILVMKTRSTRTIKIKQPVKYDRRLELKALRKKQSMKLTSLEKRVKTF